MDPNGWMFETILRVVWRIRNRYGERDGLLENLLNLNLIMDFFLILLFLFPVGLLIYLFLFDRRQKEHSILRNYPILGKMRYFLEKIGPELRQYLFNNDNEGKPFSRNRYQQIVKRGKYLQDLIGFGSERDFGEPGYYIRNTLFPKQEEELRVDREPKIATQAYIIRHDGLFSRKEKRRDVEEPSWLLPDQDAVVIGAGLKHPFRVRGLIGMSAMSYGALGERAITSLSKGLARAGGTWMNTGEGGLSPYHQAGDVDLILQIGPGLFGVRDREGDLDWDALREKAEMERIRAFELKLGQGAKLRGGHVDGSKVTPEIARIRGVEPWRTIDSPNRFRQFGDIPSMMDWIDEIRTFTGKPVGIKIVVGGRDTVEPLVRYMAEQGNGPDFITVDGGEGGTGASYQELADGVGLPIKSALMLTDALLRKYGVRERVKLIASGKLATPDEIAVALGMGADLIHIARGFMISVGCIQALRCHSNECPVGVATTDPKLQRALVVEEKEYRVTNYVLALRKGLFRLAAAAGLESPVEFGHRHVVYKDEKGLTTSLEEIAHTWMEDGKTAGAAVES
ncbi:FMN-binding glutamate synthase family protein [Kroppenstedtia eburnea]|uniref:Glutamate synthase domain-containing protein 2 n=1 Tax=Kroppenstedtia eburnea TaxID=714067 RepID=A0A1N7NAT0_9BACL|nr:FMN-binding glutamate synthase family protein [Kroppenstedtia eburnea]SIS95321.1 Glutamate synthase domain-containing protein 2 [Kroppenstedtia eburnea]